MRNKKTRHSGHTLIEAMFASFLALLCALIFSATIPIANLTKGKADNLSSATALAQKTIETVRGKGYPNATNQRFIDTGVVDGSSLVSMSSLGIGSAGEQGLEFTNADSAIIDSPGTVLAGGRGFIWSTQSAGDLREVTVVVMWKEKSVTKSMRLTTLIANF